MQGLRERLVREGFSDADLVAPALDDSYRLTKAGAVALPGAARLPAEAAARPDWHNARAEFLIQLNQRLQEAPTDAEREALLSTLSSALPSGRVSAQKRRPA